MEKILLTLFVLILSLIALRGHIGWQYFYLTSEKVLSEELTLPDEYYIYERLSNGDITFVRRLPNGDNQFIFSKLDKITYSNLVERGIVFKEIEESVHMIDNIDDCISVLFVDDFFALTVTDSCDKKIELSSLIFLLRQYYNPKN
jgi:hypothetical protein